MSRVNLVQGNFSSGEVTPKLYGRVDLERYLSGLKTLTNFILLPQGGCYRRSGSVFASEIKDSSAQTTLIPFEVSTLAAYMIEAGNEYFRFYVNNGQLIVSSTPVEVSTPYLTADLPLIDYTQNANALFLVHPSHPPQVLTRTSVSAFTMAAFDYQDGPYQTINGDPTITITPSGFTSFSYTDPITSVVSTKYKGSGTLTATSAIFAATDVGRWVRLRHGATWGAARITAFTDAMTVTALVKVTLPFGDETATIDWRLGAWSNTTGWPSAIMFHEGRLCFGCTPAEPDGFWASEAGIYNLFSPTEPDVSVIDSDGLGYTIVSAQVNAIQWLLSARTLLLGTYGSEWAIRSSATSTPITPTNIAVQQQSSFGSQKVRPFQIGESTIYVQKSGRKLREMTYNYAIDGWTSVDISILSEHLFRKGGGVIQAAYQQEPDSTWWGLREDGTLICMTYIKDQKVIGFSRCILGGSFNGGQAIVESIGKIPNPDGSMDQLWLIVKRTIAGVTKRYVEYFDKPFLPEDDVSKTDMNFLDCSLTYNSTPTSVVSGLDYLTGETVGVIADTTARPDAIVSNSGEITLDRDGSLIRVGYTFVSDLNTLALAVEGDHGTGQGKIKRIDRIFMRFYQSIGCKIGPTEAKLKPILFVDTASDMDVSPPLFSGDKEVYFNDDYNLNGTVLVRQTLPYPCTILAIMPQLVVAS